MKWKYKVSTERIWTSFDYGTVYTNTEDEALKLAKEKVSYNLSKVNSLLSCLEITININQLEIKRYEN